MPDPAVDQAKLRAMGIHETYVPSSSSASGGRRVFDVPETKRGLFGKKKVAFAPVGEDYGTPAYATSGWGPTVLTPPTEHQLSSLPKEDLSWMTWSERRAYKKEIKLMEENARAQEKYERELEKWERKRMGIEAREQEKWAVKEYKAGLKAKEKQLKEEEKEARRLRRSVSTSGYPSRPLPEPTSASTGFISWGASPSTSTTGGGGGFFRKKSALRYSQPPEHNPWVYTPMSTFTARDLPVDQPLRQRLAPTTVVLQPFSSYGVRNTAPQQLAQPVLSRTMTHALVELDNESRTRMWQRGFIV